MEAGRTVSLDDFKKHVRTKHGFPRLKYCIRVTARAMGGADAAAQWIAEHSSPAQAERGDQGLFERIETLANQPLRCPVIAESRRFPEGSPANGSTEVENNKYRIVFTVRGDDVVISTSTPGASCDPMRISGTNPPHRYGRYGRQYSSSSRSASSSSSDWRVGFLEAGADLGDQAEGELAAGALQRLAEGAGGDRAPELLGEPGRPLVGGQPGLVHPQAEDRVTRLAGRALELVQRDPGPIEQVGPPAQGELALELDSSPSSRARLGEARHERDGAVAAPAAVVVLHQVLDGRFT